jgi:hypothetical protein
MHPAAHAPGLPARSRARDAQWAAWALPLAAGALLRADPPPPPATWLQAIALAAQVKPQVVQCKSHHITLSQ